MCRRWLAAQRSETWGLVMSALLARGARAYSVTLTQPQLEWPAWPCLLTEAERRVYSVPLYDLGDAAAWASVPGEPLSSALARLRDAWAAMRNGRASLGWWRATVLGGVYGVEATARRSLLPDGGPPYVPRWHVHMHAMVLLRPGVDVDGWWVDVQSRWCEVSGGAPEAQHLRPVVDVADAVREVLKYPLKLATMTEAQTVDWLAVTKGLRWGCPFGQLHGSSPVRQSAGELAADCVDVPDDAEVSA